MAERVRIPPKNDWPLFWFAKLEAAIDSGDHQTAAEAQKNLARLGVQVRYGSPARSGGGVAHAS